MRTWAPCWAGLSLAGALLAAVVGGCSARPPQAMRTEAAAEAGFPAADYRKRSSQGRVFWLDAEASTLRIFAWRAGPLASQGHNHVLLAGDLHGAVFLPTSGIQGARFDVAMPLDGLRVDPPELRASLGEGFASELSDEDRTDTRRNMLGDAMLHAAVHPLVVVRSTAIRGELPSPTASIEIELHGTRRELRVPLRVEMDGDRLVASGSFDILQSDFGITPFSVAAGLLQVADEVRIDFALVAMRGSRPR